MKPCYEIPDSNSNFQQTEHGRSASPGLHLTTRPSSGASRKASGFELVVRWSIRFVRRWHRRRAAIRALESLSDHYLRDIGLDRSQIISRVERNSYIGGNYTGGK